MLLGSPPCKNTLRRHNYIGLVRPSNPKPSIPLPCPSPARGSRTPRRQSMLTARAYMCAQVHGLLVELAKQGKLSPQIEAAKQKMKERIAEKRAKGEMMDED